MLELQLLHNIFLWLFFFFFPITPMPEFSTLVGLKSEPPHTKVCLFRRTPAHPHKAWSCHTNCLNKMLVTFHNITTPTPAQYCVLTKLYLSILPSPLISLQQHLKEISFGSFLLVASEIRAISMIKILKNLVFPKTSSYIENKKGLHTHGWTPA